MSVTDGAFEAKTHFLSLLDCVEMGEEILITKHGRPVARLVPAEAHAGVRDLKEFWSSVDEHRVALSAGSSTKEDIAAGRA
ncbi:MAG: type II toxin-antitoxin system prevent-host-death family antitoxin [Candidatus Nanopelagicales bacterium]